MKNFNFLILIFLLLISQVLGIEFTRNNTRMTFHGYMDFEWTRMTSMPMNMTSPQNPLSGIGTMKSVNFIDLNRTNLLGSISKNKWKIHLNLQMRHLYSQTIPKNEGVSMGNMSMMMGSDSVISLIDMMSLKRYMHLQQGFLDYQYNDKLSFRAGVFLPPFGLYNDIRYLTPLYATVVLPMIYENMPIYLTQWGRHQELLPQVANFMISGTNFLNVGEFRYYFYGGYGKDHYHLFEADFENFNNQPSHRERNIGLGLKFELSIFEKINTSISNYFYNHSKIEKTTSPRDTLQTLVPSPYFQWENIFGLSFQYMEFNDRLTFQIEWIQSIFETRQTRSGLYSRLMYNWSIITPFLMFDKFTDNENLLFKNSMNRFGTGLGVRLTDNFYLKGEYHYHWFSDVEGLKSKAMMGNSDALGEVSEQHMIRTKIITVF